MVPPNSHQYSLATHVNNHGARARLPTAAVLLVLLWAVVCVPHAASQGLDVSQEALGVGSLATAGELLVFEDVLALAVSSTGGRGRSGRGTGGQLGSGSYQSNDEMGRLQTATYNVGLSPKAYLSSRSTDVLEGLSVVPPVRDQGVLCSSCVGQAVATAVQMAVAKAVARSLSDAEARKLRVSDFDIDARSLYYCAQGGRTCRTGWDIPDALRAVLDEKPELLRPSICLDNALGRTEEADVSDWSSICRAAARSDTNATDGLRCRDITPEQPLYTCSYTALSSFWQIQQHVRNHGAVITRIQVNDDFNQQFNASAKERPGQRWPPYRYNATARPAFAHAALIVGYNNSDFTWTLLNSWGSGRVNRFKRPQGITADGTFRIQMGVGGVGTPDATYGVKCEPAVGSPRNPSGSVQAWRSRLPALSTPDKATGCMDVLVTRELLLSTRDIASYVDISNADIRSFVQANADRFGGTKEFRYKFDSRLSASEMIRSVTVANAQTVLARRVARGRSSSVPGAHFTCSSYDAKGVETSVKCMGTTEADYAACAKNGTVACTLVYHDVNVVAKPRPGVFRRLCLEAWKRENDPASFLQLYNLVKPDASGQSYTVDRVATEALALDLLLSLADPDWGRRLNLTERNTLSSCGAGEDVVNTEFETGSGRQVRYVRSCEYLPEEGYKAVVGITLNVVSDAQGNSAPEKLLPNLNAAIKPMLALTQLRAIDMVVFDGYVPSELGSLRKLEWLRIYHYCMRGVLPPSLLEALPSLTNVRLQAEFGAENYVPQDGGGECGIRGQIPQRWARPMVNLTEMVLQSNALTGEVPPRLIVDWPKLYEFNIRDNKLTGELPDAWGGWRANIAPDHFMHALLVDSNQFSGLVPKSWRTFEGKLLRLDLYDNAELSGCVPLSTATTVAAKGTKLSSPNCKTDGASIEVTQRAALRRYLPLFLSKNTTKSRNDTIERVLVEMDKLGSILKPGQISTSISISDAVNPDTNFWIFVDLVDGAEMVKMLWIQYFGMDTRYLAPLARGLPGLKDLVCDYCFYYRGPPGDPALLLPEDLPEAAPQLEMLMIADGPLAGSVPASYGQFKKMHSLWLLRNQLSGQLPLELGNMASMKNFYVSENKISGSLPDWGSMGVMPSEATISVAYNPNITGTVPPGFAHFSRGFLAIEYTQIKGCWPDGLQGQWGEDKAPVYCSETSPQIDALKRIKALLLEVFSPNDALDSWDTSRPGDAGPGLAPRYCRLWVGITCNSAYEVTGLNLARLKLNSVRRVANMLLSIDMFVAVADGLKELRELDGSGVGFGGSLPDAIAPTFVYLEHLNISNNPGVVGQLPRRWAGLVRLRNLDLSGTGISGGLPSSYAALQSLQELHLAGCSGINGTLPVEWGLMQSLRVINASGASISGSLPPEWADSELLRRAAPALIAGAEAAAASEQRAADKVYSGVYRRPTRPTSSVDRMDAANIGSSSGRRSSTNAPAGTAAEYAASVSVMRQHKRAAAVAAQEASTLRAAAAGALGLSNLEVLALSNNRLNGQIPASYSVLTKLRVIELGGNLLSGELPARLSALSALEVLSLNGNRFSGVLPDSIARLTKLRSMDLAGNEFSGLMPETWISLSELTYLDISGNAAVVGVIPDSWEFFAMRGHNLRCLDIRGTNLTGVLVFKDKAYSTSSGRLRVLTAPGDTC